MLNVLAQTDQQLVAIRISQCLTGQDYLVLRTLFNDRLDHDDPLLWYIEMVDFEGWGPEGLWSDFVLQLHHDDKRPLSRVAFVAGKPWEDWIGDSYQWLNAIYPSQPVETKFFPNERRAEEPLPDPEKLCGPAPNEPGEGPEVCAVQYEEHGIGDLLEGSAVALLARRAIEGRFASDECDFAPCGRWNYAPTADTHSTSLVFAPLDGRIIDIEMEPLRGAHFLRALPVADRRAQAVTFEDHDDTSLLVWMEIECTTN